MYSYLYTLTAKIPCINTKNSNKVTKCKKFNWLQFIKKCMHILLTYKDMTYTWTLTAKFNLVVNKTLFCVDFNEVGHICLEASLACLGPQEDGKLKRKSRR